MKSVGSHQTVVSHQSPVTSRSRQSPVASQSSMRIRLNGDAFELAGPSTVSQLLERLEIDARRVAVEHNLVVIKRAAYDSTEIRDGDEIEIVNFVGGG